MRRLLVIAGCVACSGAAAPPISETRTALPTGRATQRSPTPQAPRVDAGVIAGRDLPVRSCGLDQGSAWLLDCTGYVGAYLRVPQAGSVTIDVQASGIADRGQLPRLELVVADASSRFDVGAGTRTYTHRGSLPAGTYFVRLQHSGDPELTIHAVSARGASLLPSNGDADALAAADTYVRHYRRGRAKLRLPGVPAGSRARIALTRHAFNFGANVPFRDNRLIPAVTEPGSDAAWYQQVLIEHFNTVVLSNGGKWLYQEEARDRVQLDYIDRFLDFAEQHRLRARMHTLLWDTVQQPAWIVSETPAKPGLLTLAKAGDARAKRELSSEIDERIDYYVRQRARRYVELDVLNESLHRPRYWQAYGPEGTAELFNKAAAAVKAAGATTRLFLNEYNVLQWSTDPVSGVRDAYANWYRLHGEQLARAGGTFDGFGVQYYADGRPASAIGSNAHSPARIQQVLQNLSLSGRRISLTEFSVNAGNADPNRAADILEQTLRMVFGTPQADSFLIWAIWAGAADPPAPVSALFDEDRNLTEPGRRYVALRERWHTDVELPVASDGSVELDGFYGDYEVSVPGGKRSFTLTKGTTAYDVGE